MTGKRGWPNWHEMSTGLRRPRSDSKLDALDAGQQRRLCELLLTSGLSYDRIKDLVFKEFNVTTTEGSLSRFYQAHVSAYLVQRRAQSVGLAHEVGAEVRKTPGQFSEVTIDALEQKAFELANNPMVDPKAIKTVFTLLLQHRDHSLKEKDIELKLRRLQLLEENSRAAKDKLNQLASRRGGISEETLLRIEEAAKLL